MGSITLTLEQALAIANREDKPADVRVLGLLSAAAVLSHTDGHTFQIDYIDTLEALLDNLQEKFDEARIVRVAPKAGG